ncbi:ATP-binding protein [Streptomyces sp. NPDC101115]|uniref:ATP-binding protein n=1 Tax=Streptomyces sp. NPDC101115 TaxID=3366106 RepID=UPI00380121CD
MLTEFSPATPIKQSEVFAGRRDQLEALQDAMWQAGQHAVIYGDRGVGKTSLAMVAQGLARGEGLFTSLITCDSTSTFASVWRQVFREIEVTYADEAGEEIETNASYLLNGDVVTPDDVRLAFKVLSLSAPVVVFLDEYDVIAQSPEGPLFANLIKILSDHGVGVTVVFVGVAEDVNKLIADHASVQRVLAEVSMPRMDAEEQIEIVKRGFSAAGMTADDDVYSWIPLLSQGMPAIVHQIGQQSGFAALKRNSYAVTSADVETAIKVVVEKNLESISTVYDSAVFSSKPGTLFKTVALACACAAADEKGFFSSPALRLPLKVITGKSYEIPAYSPHLNDFSKDRGPLLVKVGAGKTIRYRFVSPLIKPYIVLRALKEGQITQEVLETLLSPGGERGSD